MAAPATPAPDAEEAEDASPDTDPASSEPTEQPDANAAVESAISKANKQAAKYRSELRAAQEKIAGLEAASMSDQERAATEARDKAVAEVDTKWRERFVTMAIRAAAGGKLSPKLAERLIDRSAIQFDDDDEIDQASLDAAIDELLTENPNLAAQQQAPPAPPAPKVPAGPRGTAAPITAEQLRTMSPDEIDAAHRAGQLDHLLKA